MKYSLTEKQVLKKLQIPDFNHMTKDKVVKFVSMLPRMDPEVAKAAIEQFPVFKDFAHDIVSDFKHTIDSILEKNGESQRVFYDACNSIIESLKDELEDDDLDHDERDRIENKMIQVATMISEKDSENKRFLAFTATAAAVVGAAALTIGSALLGNNTSINGHMDNNNDDDESNRS